MVYSWQILGRHGVGSGQLWSDQLCGLCYYRTGTPGIMTNYQEYYVNDSNYLSKQGMFLCDS